MSEFGEKSYPGTPMAVQGGELVPVCARRGTRELIVGVALCASGSERLLAADVYLRDLELNDAASYVKEALGFEKHVTYAQIPNTPWMLGGHGNGIPVFFNRASDRGAVSEAFPNGTAYSSCPPTDNGIHQPIRKYFGTKRSLLAAGFRDGVEVVWDDRDGHSPTIHHAPALKELAIQHLRPIVTSPQFKKSAATCLSRRHMQDFFVVRVKVEEEGVAQLAANAARDTVVQRAAQINEQMKVAARNGNKWRFVQLDVEFHAILLGSLGALGDFISFVRYGFGLLAFPTGLTWAADTLKEHDDLLNAVRAGPELARQAVRRHLQNALRRWELNLNNARAA